MISWFVTILSMHCSQSLTGPGQWFLFGLYGLTQDFLIKGSVRPDFQIMKVKWQLFW